MAFVYRNPNPMNNLVGDCVIRGISILTDKTWEYIFIELVAQAYSLYDMPSSNKVWGAYLKSQGYEKRIIPNTCPNCYSVRQFCKDNPKGKFLLATGTHVVAVIDGDYYDTWNSGDEVPIYYFQRRNNS